MRVLLVSTYELGHQPLGLARPAASLSAAGHDVAGMVTRRARLVYRKPCFSGEGYRRIAWFCGEAPLVIGTAVAKSSDASTSLPAVAAELTLAQHEPH